jgi:hypothetical protein
MRGIGDPKVFWLAVFGEPHEKYKCEFSTVLRIDN